MQILLSEIKGFHKGVHFLELNLVRVLGSLRKQTKRSEWVWMGSLGGESRVEKGGEKKEGGWDWE